MSWKIKKSRPVPLKHGFSLVQISCFLWWHLPGVREEAWLPPQIVTVAIHERELWGRQGSGALELQSTGLSGEARPPRGMSVLGIWETDGQDSNSSNGRASAGRLEGQVLDVELAGRTQAAGVRQGCFTVNITKTELQHLHPLCGRSGRSWGPQQSLRAAQGALLLPLSFSNCLLSTNYVPG